MQYTVIVEQDDSSRGAYLPDLLACVAAGESREEVVSLIQEAIELHTDELRKDGQPIPRPHSFSELIEIDAA
jgi:predicted RNase H-like HicB family nuclease